MSKTGSESTKSANFWVGLRRVHWATASLALGGVLLSILFFHTARDAEISRTEAQFEDRVDHQISAIRRTLEAHEAVLNSLGSFVKTVSDQDLDQDRFSAFVAPLVAQIPGIQALEWVPRVPLNQRLAFEGKATSREFPDYLISEYSPAGDLVSAAERDEYFPVWLAYPLAGNRKAVGFDLGSEANRFEAINRAMETDQATATAPIILVQEQRNQSAYLEFLPVWGAPSENRVSRELKGFVLGVFRAEDVITNSLRGLVENPLPMSIKDLDAAELPLIYGQAAGNASGDQMARVLSVSVGGRLWQMRMTANSPVGREPGFLPWMILWGGLALTAITGILLMVLARSHAAVESVVRQRTGELKISEDLLARERKLFTGGPVVVFRWRAATGWPVEYVSPNVRTVFGVEVADLTSGRVSYSDFIHPEDVEAVGREVEAKAAAGINYFEQDYRIIDRSGCVRSVVDFTVVVRNDAGEATHYEGYVLDVSEREEARQQLLENRQRLNLALSGAALGLWDWNVQTGTVYFDERWAAMLGYEVQELTPDVETWSRLVHPDDLPQVMAILKEHLDGNTTQYESEHRLQHKDGSWVWVLDRGKVLQREKDGLPLRAVGTHLNITERRLQKDRHQAWQMLREQTTQALARCISPADINGVARSITEELAFNLGASYAFMVRLNDRSSNVRTLLEWPTPRESGPRGYRHASEPHSDFWWRLTADNRGVKIVDLNQIALPPNLQKLLDSKNVQGIALIIVPITPTVRIICGIATEKTSTAWLPFERETMHVIREAFAFAQQRIALRHDNELTRRQLVLALERAEQTNKVKTTFLARMSHEIRTPMTAIVGLSDILTKSNSHLDEREREWLKNIHHNADHLVALLNDLLDISKIDVGELQISNEPVNMQDILETVQATLQPRAQEKMINLEITLQPEVPVRFTSDGLRLRQILLNLAGNAVKFTDRGTVDVDVNYRQIDGDCPGELVVLVRDSGVGIAKEQIEAIFQPFLQAPNDNLASRGGTGLGLDISRRLARALGGDITVVSQLGLGSAFTFTLPLAEVSSNAVGGGSTSGTSMVASDDSAALKALAGKRILLVDDNSDNRQVVRFYLEEAGVELDTAEDGAKGVDRARSAKASGSPYDVILMDMRMPVMNGYDATLCLRKSGFKTPIIALTAHAMDGDEQACLNFGCNAYVSKPIVQSTLLTTIATLLPPGECQIDESRHIPVVDLCSNLVDNPRFAPHLRSYLEGLPSVLDDLTVALAKGHREAVRNIVHRIHGTAANFGFPTITDEARNCEAALSRGDGLETIAGLTTLTQLLAAAIAGRKSDQTVAEMI
jgi:PAS domain S-box-containing protein